jgi:two-component system cell cycle sensor histidine kinase/response regulator CckA
MTARRRPRVLVIDDEPTTRELLCDFPAVLGYDAAGAADGAEGLALFKRGGYGLVVTDGFMPGMNGWDVVAAVRQQAPAMPMVLISGFARAGCAARPSTGTALSPEAIPA